MASPPILTTALPVSALYTRLLEVATDIGRLRKRWAADPEAHDFILIERLADHADVLYHMVSASAAELQRYYTAVCGDEDVAVDEALAVVDAQSASFRRLLGRG